MDPAIAFSVREHDDPALEIRVNFGVFAGRQATPAEIDNLARDLRDEVSLFSVVAEERHEFDGDVEASLHQVVIEVDRTHAGDDPDVLCERIVELADEWASACIADRHTGLADL